MSHRSPHQLNRISRAPYNFVRLPDTGKYLLVQPSADSDRYNPKRYTGHIALSLTTKTPLYTRCAPVVDGLSVDPTKSQGMHDFFHHGELLNRQLRPVIPGSSLRGMVANLVGIIGHARMKGVTDKQMFFRSVYGDDALADYYRLQTVGRDKNAGVYPRYFEYPLGDLLAGWVEKKGNGWAIRPALEPGGHGLSFVLVGVTAIHRIGINTSAPGVEDIFVQPTAKLSRQSHNQGRVLLDRAKTDNISRSHQPGFEPASLVFTGPPVGQRHFFPAVFEPDPQATPIAIPDDLWGLYEEDRDIPRDPDRTPRSLQQGEPVFYRKTANGLQFGPCMLFRFRHRQTAAQIVAACQSTEGTDLVQAIFGEVAGERIRMGRVHFCDLQLKASAQTEDIFISDQPQRLATLGSPKPTAFQHYLAQQEPENAKKLTHWSEQNAELRGYKLYWHRKNVSDGERYKPTNAQESNMDTLPIHPVREGVRFEGKVYFENLDDLELGALLTSLQVPDSMCHKLGMGKPYGLGSVRIDARLHLDDRLARYDSLLRSNEKSEDEVREVSAKAKRVLVTAIETLYRLNSGAVDIWGSPIDRIASDLKSLLNWEAAPDHHKTAYLPLEDHAWKSRKVLPYPKDVLTPGASQSSPPINPGQTPRDNYQDYPDQVMLQKMPDGEMRVKSILGKRKLGILLGQEPADLSQIYTVKVDTVGKQEGKWHFKIKE